MPNYNVEVFVYETDGDEAYKIVWVANYKDAAQAIETAGRRAIGISNYMRKTGADVYNLGGVMYKKNLLHKDRRVTDSSEGLKKITDFE